MSNQNGYSNNSGSLLYSQVPRQSEYRPFITIQQFPSHGRVWRIKGNKALRVHEFFSDLEQNYFYILEFSELVLDIREQFPLNLEQTVFIADKLGISHPVSTVTKKPIVMTSDFCITLRHETFGFIDIVRTIKYAEELANQRVIEKFAIEHEYWQSQNIDWGIVTEKDINKDYCHNLKDILDYSSLADREGFIGLNSTQVEELRLSWFNELLDQRVESLRGTY